MIRRLPTLKLPVTKTDYIPFAGGLDTESPVMTMEPGRVRESSNFEIGVSGRYSRIAGYERFDGQEKPSDALYFRIDVTITGSLSLGDVVTGVTSGATGTVILIETTASPNYIIVTKVTGSFDVAEDLNVSAVKEAETLSSEIQDGAPTIQLDAEYRNLAADEYRADIAAVPGSGSINGVWMLNDVVYAVRNNAGATAADVYKSTAAGWVQVALGFELPFTSGGTYEVLEGDTITGATSTSTAVVTRVVLESGTWAGGDAAGRFIYASQSGAFVAENLDVGANLDVATIAADGTAITLAIDGYVETDIQNFGGASGTKRVYGADGVNRGFEFDGTVWVPINTGMSPDTPTEVIVHKQHLFFSFGSSAQHSGIGTPYIWTPLFGAGELAVGSDITGFQTEPGAQGGGALGIYSRNAVHILYGSSASDWDLVRYRRELGAYKRSLVQLGTTYFLDDRGVMNLQTAQTYGNFIHGTITTQIQRWINARRTLCTGSCIVRNKSQYRLFFGDEALYMTILGDDVLGLMPQKLAHPITAMFSLEDNAGAEVIMFGSDDGFVYEMEKGTSFDGADIEFILNLQYVHSQSPRVLKKYRNISLEMAGEGYAEFFFAYELGYTSTEIEQPPGELGMLTFASTRWDAFTWDAFFWDGAVVAPTNLGLNGSAENISLIVRGVSDEYPPFQVSGALIRYDLRRQLRT